MGQHKHNPNVKLAKEGALPQKTPKKSKREVERELYHHLIDKIYCDTGLDKVMTPPKYNDI